MDGHFLHAGVLCGPYTEDEASLTHSELKGINFSCAKPCTFSPSPSKIVFHTPEGCFTFLHLRVHTSNSQLRLAQRLRTIYFLLLCLFPELVR